MSKFSKERGAAPLGVGDLIRLARLDFGVFAVVMFPELHDGKQMVPAPYVNLMAEALMAVRDGAEKRLIFNLPPGHMKSLIIAVLFSAWLLGDEPSKRILCIRYGDDLTRQLSRLTRRVMTSRLYRRIFPGTVLTKLAEDLLTTTKGGQRLATAVGGAVAGFGAELTIIDDPMQPDEVASELKKQGLRDWYSGVVEQRLIPGGAMIVVMHRLAPDDFTATLLEKGGWFHLSLPFIAVEALTYTDRSGRDFWTRKPGDLLSPGWTTPQAVDDIRRSLPKEIFEGQYRQNPQFGGSGICSIDRLARFQERSHYELIVHCWDLAGTKSGGDWTVCAKFGLTRDQQRREVFDLLEIIRVRIELPDVRELRRRWTWQAATNRMPMAQAWVRVTKRAIHREVRMRSKRQCKTGAIQLRTTATRTIKRHAVNRTVNRQSSGAILAELKHRLSEIYDLTAAGRCSPGTRPPICRRAAP